MSEQDAPSRRLVWIVRLVFYPLALGLIAIAWHQRHARADDGAVTAPPNLTQLTGRAGDQPATAQVVDGRLHDVSVMLRFRCVPDVGEVWASYLNLPPGAERRPTTWPSGWYGLADLEVDARLEGRHLGGAVSARLTLDANGVSAECRAAPVALALDGIAGRDGWTAQQLPVRAAVDADGRPSALAVTVRMGCDDGTEHSVVWAPRLDGAGRAQRSWGAVGREASLLVGPGDDGRLVARAARDDGRVRGSVAATVTLDGVRCATPPGDVAFAVDAG